MGSTEISKTNHHLLFTEVRNCAATLQLQALRIILRLLLPIQIPYLVCLLSIIYRLRLSIGTFLRCLIPSPARTCSSLCPSKPERPHYGLTICICFWSGTHSILVCSHVVAYSGSSRVVTPSAINSSSNVIMIWWIIS